MKTETLRISNNPNLNEEADRCPLPISVFPNHMGINLCSVEAVTWQKQEDGQLVSIVVHFLPEGS